MRRIIRHMVWVLVAVGMAACTASRKAGREPMVGGLTGEAYLEKVIELSPEWQTLSGKVALQLDLGAKGNTKVNATMRLKKGELIRLSVAPLLGIEVARLDITPEGLLAIERINKRYVQASFEEIRNSWQVDLSFNVLQSLFLNEIFFPGKLQLETGDARYFFVQTEGEDAVIRAKTSKQFSYRFRTSAADGSLLETHVGVAGLPYALNWKYDRFEPLGARRFPAHMQVVLEGSSSPTILNMDFSRLSTGGDWDTVSEVSSRYKQISLQELLKMFIK
ncbi:DUF4292 domain-containing protein [Phocaeicola faecicola]|uniref:DUF4292 domain-containing protein n=1 Tax=Phocaeicola faecicola TaxID=2739389 RepID=UPI0015E7B914|nr:DUF4292 domain-containing protein [Phocaeicola faecicola]